MKTAVLRDLGDLVKDGWSNILSGIGGLGDKAMRNKYNAQALITRPELAAIYESEGMLGRIIDIVAEDMTSAGWSIKGDESGSLAKACEDLEVGPKLSLALKWQRLFGGALIVLDLMDGLPWDQPYDPRKKAKVRSMKVYSCARTIVVQSDYSSDPASPWFEEIERFTIKRLYGPTFQVHASRCIILKGRPVPDSDELAGYDMETRYWGLSVIQSMFTMTSAFGSFVQGIGHLGQEMTIGKYTISNLEQAVAENDWKSIRNRIRIIDESKSVIRAVLLGENEKYERDSLTFTGIPDLLDRLMMLVSAYSDGIPVSRLFGRSAAGMNASGEGDARDYYKMIESRQHAYLKAPLLRLLKIVNLGEGSPVPEKDLGVEFRPVWTPSQKELVEMRKVVAETDKTYIDSGVLNAEQVYNTHFSKGYSTEYMIEGEYQGPDEDEEETEMLRQALEARAQQSAIPQPGEGTPPAPPAPKLQRAP